MTTSPLRRVLPLLLSLAACTAPMVERGFEREREEAEEEGLDDPEAAAVWRLGRYLDEHGNLPPRAWQTALAARAATVAARAQLRSSGVGRLAWTQRGPANVAGRAVSIAIDPRNRLRIWVGAVSGGLWRSDDGGSSWTQIDDWWSNLAVGCLALDPQNPDVMYVGTGEGFYSLAHLQRNLSHFVRGAGVLKSTDGGVTWTQLPATATWEHTTRIAVSPTNQNLLLASRRPGGLSRSTDGGQTWTDVAQGLVTDPFSYQVLFDPNDGTHAVAHLAPGSVASHGVITSTDSGLSWQPALTGLASVAGETSRIELCYARSVPGLVYACTGAGGGKIWSSTDGGRNWTLRSLAATNLATTYYYDGLWVDPTNGNHMVVGALHVWRSTDGGQTFAQITNGYIMTVDPHLDVHAVVADPGYDGASDRRVYVATDGGIHVADDIALAGQGTGWRDLDATMRSTQFYAAAGHATGDVLIGGAQDNGTLRVLGSNPSANLVFGGDGGQVQIDPLNPQFTYGEFQFLGVHRSTNGGASANQITSGLGDAATGLSNFISPLCLDPNNNQRLYGGGRSLWRTTNPRTTASWTAIKPDVGSLISAVCVTPGVPDRIFVGHNDGRLYRTTNGTAAAPTWVALDDNGASNPLPGRVLTRLAIDPSNTSVVYACFGGFAADNVWRSADAGLTWQPDAGTAPTALPPAPVYGLAVLPDDGNVLYAATEVGVFTSDDAGASWSTSNDGPANVVCEEVAFVQGALPRRLVLATLGRGLWTATIARPASVAFGTACAGAAAPPLLAVDAQFPARLGTTMAFDASALRTGQPLVGLAVGLSDQAWSGGALPFALDALGMTGCALQTSVEALLLVPVTAAGTAQWNVALPSNPQLLGVRLFGQVLASDPGANAAGLVVSRPVAVTTGW